MLAQLPVTSPRRAMGAALAGVAGAALGPLVGSVGDVVVGAVGDQVASEVTRDRRAAGPWAIDRLRAADQVLLVLCPRRLLAFEPGGARLVAALTTADLSGVTVEPSKVSPTSAVLALRLSSGAEPIRFEVGRSAGRAFAEALSTCLGRPVEHRPADRWFLLKALPVGLLYAFGAGCLLVAGLVVAYGDGAGAALQAGGMGAAGVVGGEALRRRLLRHRAASEVEDREVTPP